MNRPRPNAMPSIKAKIMATGVRGIGDHAITADPIENVPGQASIARLQKGKSRVHRDDMIGALPADRIDIGKIDNIVRRLTGHCRRLRLNFCRESLLSKTWLRKLSLGRSRIRCSHSPGSFWKKRPATMFNWPRRPNFPFF